MGYRGLVARRDFVPRQIVSQSGMSITGVLVAIGISGVLMLFISQIFQQIQKVAVYATAQSELQDGMETLTLHLSQDSNCTCNFRNETFVSTPETVSAQSVSLNSLQTFDPACANPQPLATVGAGVKGIRHLRASSVRLGNLVALGSTVPATSYTGEIQLGFDSGASIFGLPPMMRKIPVQLTVTDPGGTATIQSCEVLGKQKKSEEGTSLADFLKAMDGQKLGVFTC